MVKIWKVLLIEVFLLGGFLTELWIWMTSCREGDEGKYFSDTSPQGLGHKSMTERGGGVRKSLNLGDVIYEWSPMAKN